jgi:hypothetical protein
MRFVDANDAELMRRAHTQFMTIGRNSLVGDIKSTLLLRRAGESAVRNREGADGLAMITLQNLAVTRKRLAIEGKNLVSQIGGCVFGNHEPEMSVAKREAKIGGAVVVCIFDQGCAGISGQADLCRAGVLIGMKLKFEIRVLRDGDSSAKKRSNHDQREDWQFG